MCWTPPACPRENSQGALRSLMSWPLKGPSYEKMHVPSRTSIWNLYEANSSFSGSAIGVAVAVGAGGLVSAVRLSVRQELVTLMTATERTNDAQVFTEFVNMKSNRTTY